LYVKNILPPSQKSDRFLFELKIPLTLKPYFSKETDPAKISQMFSLL
jgi:hypothetical protein